MGAVEVCRQLNRMFKVNYMILTAIAACCVFARFYWLFLFNLPVFILYFRRATCGSYALGKPWHSRGGRLDYATLQSVYQARKSEVGYNLIYAFFIFFAYLIKSVPPTHSNLATAPVSRNPFFTPCMLMIWTNPDTPIYITSGRSSSRLPASTRLRSCKAPRLASLRCPSIHPTPSTPSRTPAHLHGIYIHWNWVKYAATIVVGPTRARSAR